jgi:hypothetical protein
MNLVLLPDGSVLTMGGGSDPNVPERFDPQTETWSTMSRAKYSRDYHSVAVLLPDGRVLSAGAPLGNQDRANDRAVEIFSPPYLFRGSRPVIQSAPSEIAYGSPFAVDADRPGEIARVSLITLGANTHSVNFTQRYVGLSFTASGSGLAVVAPDTAAEAPPGWYMLFITDAQGIPSAAKILRLT